MGIFAVTTFAVVWIEIASGALEQSEAVVTTFAVVWRFCIHVICGRTQQNLTLPLPGNLPFPPPFPRQIPPKRYHIIGRPSHRHSHPRHLNSIHWRVYICHDHPDREIPQISHCKSLHIPGPAQQSVCGGLQPDKSKRTRETSHNPAPSEKQHFHFRHPKTLRRLFFCPNKSRMM